MEGGWIAQRQEKREGGYSVPDDSSGLIFICLDL